MFNEKTIDFINKEFDKRTFTYEGEMVENAPEVSVDLKLKITGYKKMISVGDYYDYMLIDVRIIKCNDPLSAMFLENRFGDGPSEITKVLVDSLWFFINNLNLYVSEIITMFDSNQNRVRLNMIIDIQEPYKFKK